MATQKVVVEGSSGVTASQLKDLFRQIEDGSIAGKRLQAFLEHRNPWRACPFPVWKTITLGCKSTEEYVQTLRDQKAYNPDSSTAGLLQLVTLKGCRTEVDLAYVTSSDLSMKGNCRSEDVLVRAQEFGLEPCPSEVGPALRLAYTKNEQPLNHWLFIGMEPVKYFTKPIESIIFLLSRNFVQPRLGVWRAGQLLPEDFQFVFVRPRP